MTEPTPLYPRSSHRRGLSPVVIGLVAALVLALAVGAQDEPESHHPEWIGVTKALESPAWPLIRAARYDPANHFLLVDVHAGLAPHVAMRLACEDVRRMVESVDATAGFALYEAPDRVIAHHDDCAGGSTPPRAVGWLGADAQRSSIERFASPYQ